MSASVSFPTLTNTDYVWLDVTAANAWFNLVTVPSATVTTEGAIKKAATVSYSVSSLSTTYVTINNLQGDGSVIATEIPSKDSYDALKAAFDVLAASHADLISKLTTAGIM